MRAHPELVGGYFKLKYKDFVLFRKKMVENSEVHLVKAVQRGQNQQPEAGRSARKCFTMFWRLHG